MPDLSRRSALLLGGSVLFGSFGLTSTDARAATTAHGRRIADRLALARTTGTIPLRSGFAPLVGRALAAAGAGATHRLTLMEVRDLGRSADPARCFTLLFQVAGATPLAEGIYRLSAPRLPSISLLLSPVGQVGAAGRPQQVQAVINRL